MQYSIWKKSVVVLSLAAFGLTTSLIAPRRAHAIVSAGLAAPALAIVGGAYVLGAGGAGLGLTAAGFGAIGVDIGAWFFGILAAMAVIGGIVILDQDQGVVSYQAMTVDVAKKLKVNEESRAAYNAELDKINLLSRTVTEQLSLERNPTVETSMAIWKQYQDRLSPEASLAFQKLNQSALATAMKHAQ